MGKNCFCLTLNGSICLFNLPAFVASVRANIISLLMQQSRVLKLVFPTSSDFLHKKNNFD